MTVDFWWDTDEKFKEEMQEINTIWLENQQKNGKKKKRCVKNQKQKFLKNRQ